MRADHFYSTVLLQFQREIQLTLWPVTKICEIIRLIIWQLICGHPRVLLHCILIIMSSATSHSEFLHVESLAVTKGCSMPGAPSALTMGPGELLHSCFTHSSFSLLLHSIFYPCLNLLSQMCKQHYSLTGSRSVLELAEAGSYLTIFLNVSCIPSCLTKAVIHRMHVCNIGLNCQVKIFSSELFFSVVIIIY